MKRFALVACTAVLATAVGCNNGGGSGNGGASKAASTAAPATSATNTKGTGTTGTTGTRSTPSVSTGQSTTGTLKITVSPAAAAVGAQVSITMSGIAQGAQGVGMGLLDSKGNPVQVPTQSLNQKNSNELDFTVPQTANGAYSVVVQVVDANNKVLDQAMAPFTVGASARGSTPPSTAPGATVTGQSTTGTLTVAVTPGAAAAGDPVVVMLTNLDQGTAGFGINMVDTSGAATPVQGSLNQQNSSSTQVELDVTVPTLAAGVYVLDVVAVDANQKQIDDVQVSFTINAGGSAPAAGASTPVPAVQGQSVNTPPGTLTFTCTPGGGNVGDTCKVTLQGLPTGAADVQVALFDQNQTQINITQQQWNQASEVDFAIPQTPAGAYYLVVGVFDGTSQTAKTLDMAASQFTVNGAAGSSTGTTPPASGSAAGQTIAGNLAIESVSPGSGKAGDTVEIKLGGLTSGNIAMALIDPNNQSAAPIPITKATPNKANSTQSVIALDIVIPTAPAGNYVIVVADMGPNYTPPTSSTATPPQPVGEAAIPFTVN